MVGFDFTQSVGFTNPVDNPISLVEGTYFLDSWLVTNPIDVRAYNSLVFNWSIEDILGLGVWDDLISFSMRGFENENDALADSNPLCDETYFVYTESMSGFGGWPTSFFTPVFAPWYVISAVDASMRDTYSFYYRMIGSFRSMPNLIMRQPSGAATGGTMLMSEYFDLAAGVTSRWAMVMGYGRARIRVFTTLSNARVRMVEPLSGILIEVTAVPGTLSYAEFIVPKNQLYCEVTNTGGALSRIDVVVTVEEQAL